jgi:hypothetical protein
VGVGLGLVCFCVFFVPLAPPVPLGLVPPFGGAALPTLPSLPRPPRPPLGVGAGVGVPAGFFGLFGLLGMLGLFGVLGLFGFPEFTPPGDPPPAVWPGPALGPPPLPDGFPVMGPRPGPPDPDELDDPLPVFDLWPCNLLVPDGVMF